MGGIIRLCVADCLSWYLGYQRLRWWLRRATCSGRVGDCGVWSKQGRGGKGERFVCIVAGVAVRFVVISLDADDTAMPSRPTRRAGPIPATTRFRLVRERKRRARRASRPRSRRAQTTIRRPGLAVPRRVPHATSIRIRATQRQSAPAPGPQSRRSAPCPTASSPACPTPRAETAETCSRRRAATPRSFEQHAAP